MVFWVAEASKVKVIRESSKGRLLSERLHRFNSVPSPLTKVKSRSCSWTERHLYKYKFPLHKENLCLVFRVFPGSGSAQQRLSQNTPYAKEAYWVDQKAIAFSIKILPFIYTRKTKMTFWATQYFGVVCPGTC